MGELEVRGPWVASSYYQAPEFTGKWSDDGWFRTGDVATIDPEGYVKITDRTKDLVKSGGEWISTVDLENALMGHAAVAQAAVIAAKHPKWGERPIAVVVLKQGASVTAEELRAFLEPRFAKFWLPDEFVFTSQIPLTAAASSRNPHCGSNTAVSSSAGDAGAHADVADPRAERPARQRPARHGSGGHRRVAGGRTPPRDMPA